MEFVRNTSKQSSSKSECAKPYGGTSTRYPQTIVWTSRYLFRSYQPPHLIANPLLTGHHQMSFPASARMTKLRILRTLLMRCALMGTSWKCTRKIRKLFSTNKNATPWHNIPEVTEHIVIDEHLHVKLYKKSIPIPLPEWFRKGGCWT